MTKGPRYSETPVPASSMVAGGRIRTSGFVVMRRSRRVSTGMLLCAFVHVSPTIIPVLVPSRIHWYPLVSASCDDNFDDIPRVTPQRPNEVVDLPCRGARDYAVMI